MVSDALRSPTFLARRRCPAPSPLYSSAICAGGVPQTAVKFLCKRWEKQSTLKPSNPEKNLFGVWSEPQVWFVQVTHHVHSSLFNSILPGVQRRRTGKPVSLWERGEGGSHHQDQLLSDARLHLSGNHVVPDEDEVNALVCGDAQRSLDALQISCNIWESGRLHPAVAADT